VRARPIHGSLRHVLAQSWIAAHHCTYAVCPMDSWTPPNSPRTSLQLTAEEAAGQASAEGRPDRARNRRATCLGQWGKGRGRAGPQCRSPRTLMPSCLLVRTCPPPPTHIHAHCIYVHVHASMYVYVSMYMYTYMYTCTCICTCVHVSMYMYMDVLKWLCTYVHGSFG
jgi:hypothetical protein